MNKLRVYISHSIRGIKGSEATHDEMSANNAKAIEFCQELKVGCPDVDFYCPAEHDEFVSLAYENEILTDVEILEIDCRIINDRHLVLAWEPGKHTSNGMMTELVHAAIAGVELAVVKTVDQAIKVINAVQLRRLR